MSQSQHEAPAARDITAAAGKLGRDAGKAAASWIFDGSTPEGTYRRVLRGIEDGDPLIMDAYQAPGLSAATGYTETGLADDLGLDAGDEALAGAVTAYLDTAAESFWHEAERIARAHLYPSGCRTCACCGFPEMDATPSAANAARPGASRVAPAVTPTASGTAWTICEASE